MADMLWTVEELQAALGTDCSGTMPSGVNGVSIDTRTLQPGDLFVAIRGERTDGHKYIEQAFAAGAALAVVEDGFDAVSSGPLLRVADTYDGEVQATVKRVLTMLEPVLILGLGVLIAAIIMSILVAIISVNDIAF